MQEWIITQSNSALSKGQLVGPLMQMACAIGRSGVVLDALKVEGDGATPLGRYPVRRVFFRPDKIERPITGLRVDALSPDMGWCDDPDHELYNQLVRSPFGASHEKLWREDDVYDLILVIGHNDDPVKAGAGSCIFLHVMRGDYEPTQGCASFPQHELLKILRVMQPDDMVTFKQA